MRKIKKGEVYLVNFGKKYQSEFGKVRPAVVMQNDFFNQAVTEQFYKTVLVVPMTTALAGGDYRLKILPRENLKESSECVANWICTLDIKRFMFDKGVITILTEEEIIQLETMICQMII